MIYGLIHLYIIDISGLFSYRLNFGGENMFKSITLHTNKLTEIQHFYLIVLQFRLINSTVDSFTIQVGESSLTFFQSEEPARYHFAFNIPGNQVQFAKTWLDGRATLNLENEENEIYYESFDADAIYFDDPAGNVVEFIGRRNRKTIGDFTASSIFNISEISITTPLVKDAAHKLELFSINSRNDNVIEPESLNFLGEGDTFIILVPPNRRWYFSDKMSITCPLVIELFDYRRIVVDFEGIVTTSEGL